MNQETEIIQAIADYLGLAVDDLDRQAFLREELGLGPIEINDLIAELSQKFNVDFDPDEIEYIKKIDDLVVMVEDNLIDQ